MTNALFDPIINSEDEMVARAQLQDARPYASMYLRAYIMASLCFEPFLVVTDTAANLNRAFRALIDEGEGAGHYRYQSDTGYHYVPEVADFEWLIRKGHIQFAARNTYDGSFSELFKESQKKMKHVDLPSERYVEKLDAICKDQYVRKYSIEEASQRFTLAFWENVNDKLNDISLFPKNEKLLRELSERLGNQEKITYNMVKSTLLEEFKLDKSDSEYQYVHNILRKSYDYNIPRILGLDYCMSFENEGPSRKQEWKMDLGHEKTLKRELSFDIFALAALPAHYLDDLWISNEYEEFAKQLGRFRMNNIEPEEYMEAVSKYLAKINDVVLDYYGRKYKADQDKKSLRIITRDYYCKDNRWMVVSKKVKSVYDTVDAVRNWKSYLLEILIGKVFPNLAKVADDFPDPPEEMKEAIVMKEKNLI